MKAAICYEFGAPLMVEEVTLDPPGRGEVKVRVAATAICHSDVSAFNGDWGGRLPMVAGHETAGIVEEVGEQVASVKPGDRVVVSLLRSCGRCFFCLSGAPNQCNGTFASDAETHLRTAGGGPLARRFGTASFAEYTVVDQSQVVPIPEAISLDCAALLACGVITGIGAVVHTARLEAGASVVVIGTGGVGLNAVQGARLAGARRIVALDMLDSKLAVAETFGATDTINAGRDDVRKFILDLTGGRGADYVFVTVGSTAAIAQGQTLLRSRGTLTIVGVPPRTATVQLPTYHLAVGEQRILGSFMGSSHLAEDVSWLVDLYLQGRLKLDELITARYPLDQINDAIARLEAGEALRNLIVFPMGA